MLKRHAYISNKPITVLNVPYANRRNSGVLQKICFEEHDGDVRFLTGSGNWPFRACVVKNMQYNPY